jgi:non-ribosomal peptide synthetase component F
MNVLLHRYTQQEDIIIGSPVAGREHTDLEDQIGVYLNMLALRTKFKKTNNYEQLLGTVKQTTLNAFQHQAYPFDELVDELNIKRDISRNPLFDVAIIFQTDVARNSGPGQRFNGVKVNGYSSGEQIISKFDLSFNFTDRGGIIDLQLEYNSDIFTRDTAERLVKHFEQLLQAIIANPERQIDALEYLSTAEKDQLVHTFNDTSADYPRAETLVTLFEQQVRRFPDKAALRFGSQEFSFSDLNRIANQLGRYLR